MNMVEHGGDCGGDPPGGGDHQSLLGGCGSGERTWQSRNIEMRKLLKKNVKGLFLVEFDGDTKTWGPVGDNAEYFLSLLGNVVQEIPFWYPSWDKVPEEEKIIVYPKIEMYFYLQSHFNGPKRKEVREGIERMFVDRYRDMKSKF